MLYPTATNLTDIAAQIELREQLWKPHTAIMVGSYLFHNG